MKWFDKVKDRTWRWLFYLCLAGVSTTLTFRLHSDTGTLNWQSEIWADCAGYYIYMPATILYGLDFDKFPDRIDEKTGYGFHLDPETRTFRTKYPIGVAVFAAPFFLGAAQIAQIAGIPLEGGFAPIFYRAADLAAVFYLLLGLLFLQLVLERYFRKITGYIVVLAVFLGTNLFFFTLRSPLMPHVFSFFLAALFINSIEKFTEKPSPERTWLLAFSLAFAILVRPVNALLLVILAFWNVRSAKGFLERIRLLLTVRTIMVFVIAFAVAFIPQMLFWKYMYGQFIWYSYQGESFSNWADPYFLEVWFAPLNGLFLYTPLFVLIVAGMVWSTIRREANGILVLVFFMVVSYTCAAWHSWFFGCGFGQRQFIDYLPLFAFPLAFLFDRLYDARRKILFFASLVLVVAASVYNVKMTKAAAGCFYGSAWDWPQFGRELARAGICSIPEDRYVFTNDFENGVLSDRIFRTDSVVRSGMMSAQMDRDIEFNCRKSFYLYEFGKLAPAQADVSVWIWSARGPATGAHIVCWIDRGGQTVSWQGAALDSLLTGAKVWTEVTTTFTLPDSLRWDDMVSVNIWNPQRQLFFADDMKIIFTDANPKRP